jgi:hypothetical protein
MNRAEFEKAHQAHMEQQRLAKAARLRDTKGRANAPGPTLPECEECGEPASHARGDFGRPTDRPEHFCTRHAPESLRRPGDFLPTLQQP